MSDARERRRAQAEASKPSADPVGWMKQNKVPLIIGLVWLLFVGYNVAAMNGIISAESEDGCPGHWHTRFQVYADSEYVNFANYPQFNQLGSSDAAGYHLHNTGGSDPEIMHFHPATERCIPLDSALKHVGITVTGDSLTLNAPLREAGVYSADANNTVDVWHKPFGKDWVLVDNVGRFMDKQMQNGDRLLIYHGSAEGVALAQESLGDLGESYEPSGDATDPKFIIRIIAVTVLAVVALLIYRGLTNAAK